MASAIELVTVATLRAACPERSVADLRPWVEPTKAACQRFEINTIRRIAAFVAQMAHESGLVAGREENLNYSAERLAQVWPGRFALSPTDRVSTPNSIALAVARKPEQIANHVYANRMGNGAPATGDGWRFRGAGPLQITGRSNWQHFADAMGMSLDAALAYGRTLEGGIMAAAWFWEANDINRLADTPGVTDETKRINGGTHGLADRKARFDRTVAQLLAAERAA